MLADFYVPTYTPMNVASDSVMLSLYVFAMLAELAAFYVIQKGTASFVCVTISLAISNSVSAAVGLAVAKLLPGLITTRNIGFLAAIWISAFIISIGIEFAVLWVFPVWRRYRGLWRAVVLSNTVSYVVLGFPMILVFIAVLFVK